MYGQAIGTASAASFHHWDRREDLCGTPLTLVNGTQTNEDRKGTSGVSSNGITAKFMFFDRGTFWVLPLTYLYIPKSARAYLFPQSIKHNCFCIVPISVGPICPQPRRSHWIESLWSPMMSGMETGRSSLSERARTHLGLSPTSPLTKEVSRPADVQHESPPTVCICTVPRPTLP